MLKKRIFTAFLALVLVLPWPASAAVLYSRVPHGKVVVSPIAISFSFDDWANEMDFTDIFGNQQSYWWIEVDSEDGAIRSDCYPARTKSAEFKFDLPPDEYFAIYVSAASSLANCEAMYGGSRYIWSNADGSALFQVISPGETKPGQFSNIFHR